MTIAHPRPFGQRYAFVVVGLIFLTLLVAAGLTLITHLPDLILGLVKGALFGMAAALIACYKGNSVSKGPQGVGNAVNETVVYSFIALFLINIVATAVFYTGPQ